MEPTREIFGNIAPWMRALFYLLIAGSLAWMGQQIARRFLLWKNGSKGSLERDWRIWISRFLTFVLAQKKVHRKSLGAFLHACLFSGFVILFVGTTLLFMADKGPVNFHHGLYYLGYELTMDVFGVAFCFGCILAMYRRFAARPSSLGHNPRDWFLLSLLLSIGASGFLLEALRIGYTGVDSETARWSTVGWILSSALAHVLDSNGARTLHLITWWTHVALILAFFVYLPASRFLHVITGTLNILLRPSRAMGVPAIVTMDDVERTGRIGVSAMGHFTQQQLLSLDACMECGRCEDACPAYATHKPLSPKAVVLDLKELMELGSGVLHGETILPDTLWACTMCHACVHECPVLIGHVDLIVDMRRHLVGEGQLSGIPAQALRRIGNQGNPHGQPPSDRHAWAEGLKVPTVGETTDFDVLLWVGCAATYDPRAQKIARAMVQLLREANVRFAVLGNEEKCTGDPARRIGDEFLFQQLAEENIRTLNRHGIQRIVTPCPHCFHTIKNEYPYFGGSFEVLHHSQFLAELVASERLRAKRNDRSVTLHDPCYLARVNGESEAQRRVVNAAINGSVREMPRRRQNTFCCGAGGGRMWFEEPANQRVSSLRAREALDTEAEVLATACPYCLNMMTDGMTGIDQGTRMQVLDIAELLIGGTEAPS